jgi:hypothetical protein
MGGSSEAPGVWAALGWVAYSVIFNSLNTLVYGLLFPELYTDGFYVSTTITTWLAAIVLPFWGGWEDTHAGRVSLTSQLATSLVGVTLASVTLLASSDFMAHALYVCAMLLLRTSVMSNNALLSTFPAATRTRWSLAGNLVGFLVNLAGLYFLTFHAEAMSKRAWTALCCCVAGAAWVFTFMASIATSCTSSSSSSSSSSSLFLSSAARQPHTHVRAGPPA